MDGFNTQGSYNADDYGYDYQNYDPSQFDGTDFTMDPDDPMNQFVLENPDWYPGEYDEELDAEWLQQQAEAGGYVPGGSGGGESSSTGAKRGDKSGSKSSKSGRGGGAPTEYRFKADYPSDSEWKKNKDTIKALYLTQKLTLKEVVEVMKKKHNFVANERMYKHQFAKWDWHKYKPKDRK